MSVYQPQYIEKKPASSKNTVSGGIHSGLATKSIAPQPKRSSTKTHLKTLVERAEREHRRKLELGFNDVREAKVERVLTVGKLAGEFINQYTVHHSKSAAFAQYA